MAITNELSDQFVQIQDVTDQRNLKTTDWTGKVKMFRFTFTQGAAVGDAGSTVELVKLPNGYNRILMDESRLVVSAFGALVTMDIGYREYKDIDRDTLPENADAIGAGINVATSGNKIIAGGSEATPDNTHFSFPQVSLVIFATFTGAAPSIPVGATIDGYFKVVRE